MKDRIYLDYNSNVPLKPEVVQIMQDAFGCPGNAASVHGYGRDCRKFIEYARASIARLARVTPGQVVFNSGATESNNTVISAFQGQRILISAIEHSAVLEPAANAQQFPVTPGGIVDLEAFKDLLNTGEPPALVSIVMVNSETGAIQPVKEIAALAKQAGAKTHTDAVQAAGRIPLDFNDLGVDYMSLSAHKIAGPQGVGALIFKEGEPLPKFMKGGSQEQHRRAGSQNVAGIAGFGKAAEIALETIDQYQEIAQLRDYMEGEIRKISNEAVIYAANVPRVANTSNIGLPGVEAQTQMMVLDLEGIAVSTGSACSAGTVKPSHVLLAMGASDDEAKSALRISLGWGTTQDHIDCFIKAWAKMYNQTKKT